MKIRQNICAWVVLGLFLSLAQSACHSARKLEHQEKLLFRGENEQYWLLTLLPVSPDPNLPPAFSMLFRMRKQDSLQFLDIFYNQAGAWPNAKLGLPIQNVPKKGKFPLKLEAGQSNPEFFWFWDAKHLWFKLPAYGRQGLTFKGKLNSPKQWQFLSLLADGDIWSSSVAHLKEEGRGYKILISSFPHAEELTSHYKAAATYWLDLIGENDERISLLGHLDPEGKWHSTYIFSEGCDIPEKDFEIEALKIPSTYNKYLSHFRLVNHSAQLEVTPLNWESEISLRQSSFWMGSIDAEEKVQGKKFSGTMLIFKGLK